jgi:hypothetical protein
MTALEDWLREKGHATVSLSSTQTAHKFYLALGYRDDGPAECSPGRVGCVPMRKDLRG